MKPTGPMDEILIRPKSIKQEQINYSNIHISICTNVKIIHGPQF